MVYSGHVRNGVIVLDTPAKLAEGTAVRVEAVSTEQISDEARSRAERYRRLFQLLNEWNKQDVGEDGRVGALLERELADEHGIELGDESDLETILTEP